MIRAAPLLLLLTALLSWAGANAAAVAEPQGFWLGDSDAPAPATLHGATVVHAAEVDALLKQGGAAVIDVSNAPRRPPDLAPGAPWMPVPHPALPGAQWIPGAGAGTLTPSMDAFFRSSLARAATGRLDAPLVVYCHERCWLSWNAAKRALGYGYTRVLWFPDGIEGWQAHGGPTTAATPQADDAGAAAGAGAAAAGQARPTIAVLDLELTGDLGGPEFTAEHDARLERESSRLRQTLDRAQIYTVVELDKVRETVDRLKSQQRFLHDCNGCDLEIGRQLRTDFVMVAWVDRVSGLILSLTYEIHDVATGQITARKSYDFRGDNDSAWNHAIDYMVRDIKASTPPPP